jgi:sensor domain CHASE-containing protein
MTKHSPTLSNPFLDAQAGSLSRPPGWLTARPALTAFLLCLVLGLPIVGWRAKRHAEDAHSHARAAALARCATLELQFNQAVSAVEVLGALARQSGGAIPNFQAVAAEMLTVHRGLASLELQPGGVVRDIVPRAANEHGFGLNVLTHPVYGPGANATIQKRALTLTGPLLLYRGDAGIVARLPIFVRGRDGREAFWGFVAASMRLPEAFALARVDDLAKEGYHYAIFAPASAGRKLVTIAAHGGLSIPDAVQQPIRTQDLEFRLAVEPPGGWFSKTRLVLECVCVVAGAGLLCLLVNLLESRHAVEMALAEANQRLLSETADKQQAQDEFRSTRDEAAATRAELDRTRSALQSSTTAELRLQAAAREAEELAQARYVELEQLRAAQQQAEQTIASLQARLNAAAQDEKEAPQALQTQLEAAQATIADLQSQLETASRPEREAAEPDADMPQPTTEAFQGPGYDRDGPLSPSEGESGPKAGEELVHGADPQPEALESPQEASTAQAEEEGIAVSTPTEPASDPVTITAPELESAVPTEPEATPVPAAPPLSEAPPARKPPRAPRRKKVQRNDQMDLFETQPAAVPAQAALAVEAATKEPPVESAPGPALEPPAPSAAIAIVESAPPTADATEETLKEPRPASEPREEQRPRPLPAQPPVNPPLLRKAVNQILPLFTGKDPGARDCLKANRTIFRSAFTPEAFVEFEQSVKGGDFDAALEQLKKAARKHGISV